MAKPLREELKKGRKRIHLTTQREGNLRTGLEVSPVKNKVDKTETKNKLGGKIKKPSKKRTNRAASMNSHMATPKPVHVRSIPRVSIDVLATKMYNIRMSYGKLSPLQKYSILIAYEKARANYIRVYNCDVDTTYNWKNRPVDCMQNYHSLRKRIKQMQSEIAKYERQNKRTRSKPKRRTPELPEIKPPKIHPSRTYKPRRKTPELPEIKPPKIHP